MDGTQVVPAVPTRARGTVNLTLNTVSGALTGAIVHSVSSASGATEFQVPAGTVLSPQQIVAYQAGGMYVSIQSSTWPDGEIRAQLTADVIDIAVLPTLDDIQAKVFTPTCSGCHTGGGSSLPGIMDLTSAEWCAALTQNPAKPWCASHH